MSKVEKQRKLDQEYFELFFGNARWERYKEEEKKKKTKEGK